MIIDDKYTIQYTVPSNAIDGKYRCNPLIFAALAQDLAANHYSSTGIFLPHLQKMGLTWIISKQHFEIYEYPLWMDNLILQTWAQPIKGMFCFRDFAYYYAQGGKKASLPQAFKESSLSCGCEFLEAASIQEYKMPLHKELCVRGSSCWLVLDINTGKPAVPSSDIIKGLTFCSEHLEGRVFAKISLPENWNYKQCFYPSLLDIDMNNHVNNLNYMRWVLSFMEPEFCRGKLPHILDTNFISSAKYGEQLCCFCAYLAENTSIHSIIRTSDDSEVFRAKIEWGSEQNLSRQVNVEI